MEHPAAARRPMRYQMPSARIEAKVATAMATLATIWPMPASAPTPEQRRDRRQRHPDLLEEHEDEQDE